MSSSIYFEWYSFFFPSFWIHICRLGETLSHPLSSERDFFFFFVPPSLFQRKLSHSLSVDDAFLFLYEKISLSYLNIRVWILRHILYHSAEIMERRREDEETVSSSKGNDNGVTCQRNKRKTTRNESIYSRNLIWFSCGRGASSFEEGWWYFFRSFLKRVVTFPPPFFRVTRLFHVYFEVILLFHVLLWQDRVFLASFEFWWFSISSSCRKIKMFNVKSRERRGKYHPSIKKTDETSPLSLFVTERILLFVLLSEDTIWVTLFNCIIEWIWLYTQLAWISDCKKKDIFLQRRWERMTVSIKR